MRFITILVILISPLTGFTQIDAAYTWASEYGAQTICLKPSGQYAYIAPHCMGETIGNGTYKLQNDTLILNSYIQEDDIVREFQWNIKGLDSLYISVQFLLQDSFSYAELIINDSISHKLIGKNVLAFPRNFVQRFRIRNPVLWYVSHKTILVGQNNNIIQVFIDDTRGFHRIFHKNEKYLYRKNSLLEIPKESDDPHKPKIFVKDPALKCDDELFYRYSH